MPSTDGTTAPDLELTVFLTQEAANNLGSEPQDIAKSYLDQALNSTGYSYEVYTPSTYYNADSQTDVDLTNFADWVQGTSWETKDANLLVCNSSSGGGASVDHDGTPVAYEPKGKDLTNLDTSPELNHQNTVTGSRAVTGVLHEVGHRLLQDSNTGTEDHKSGENWFDSNNDYYVTPLLSGYDRDFAGEYNYCGNYISDPANGDKIFYHNEWSNCMENHIEPESY